MGYIFNNFDKLMELSKNKDINKQFKLTAIIVHDPKDKKLIEYIRSHFLYFAKSTGNKFLFITFIQPPKECVDAISRGEFEYAKLLVSDSKQPDTIINPYIREKYGLPQDGSYLVLTKKLSDKEVFKVGVTKNTLSDQLMYLTEYCETSQDFEGLIKKLNLKAFNITEMILDSLLKITSLISPSSSPNGCRPYAKSQRKTAKKTINEEKQKLIAALKNSSDDEDLTDKVLELYNIIENVYMNILNEGQHSCNNVQSCKNFELLDGKSQKFWNTFSRLSYYIKSASRDDLDYSAFILYLGKIVETELNLSICQMLRQSMGITMPKFYNRYCNKTDIVNIPTRNQDVPLNKCRGRKKYLEGVPLGNLLHAYKTAIGIETSRNRNWKIPNPKYLKEMPDAFLPLLEKIANLRNNAAHSQSVDVDSFKNTKNYFNEFQEKYISELSLIKNKLQSR